MRKNVRKIWECEHELLFSSFPCRSEATTISIRQFAHKYRCLQFLEQQLNAVFKYPLATFKIIHLLVIIRCMCGVVKTDGYIRAYCLNCTISIIVWLIVTFNALGQVYEKSKKSAAQEEKPAGWQMVQRVPQVLPTSEDPSGWDVLCWSGDVPHDGVICDGKCGQYSDLKQMKDSLAFCYRGVKNVNEPTPVLLCSASGLLLLDF